MCIYSCRYTCGKAHDLFACKAAQIVAARLVAVLAVIVMAKFPSKIEFCCCEFCRDFS